MAVASAGRQVSEEELAECRREKRDPHQHNADLIVALRNNGIAALEEAVAECERLKHLAERVLRDLEAVASYAGFNNTLEATKGYRAELNPSEIKPEALKEGGNG